MYESCHGGMSTHVCVTQGTVRNILRAAAWAVWQVEVDADRARLAFYPRRSVDCGLLPTSGMSCLRCTRLKGDAARATLGKRCLARRLERHSMTSALTAAHAALAPFLLLSSCPSPQAACWRCPRRSTGPRPSPPSWTWPPTSRTSTSRPPTWRRARTERWVAVGVLWRAVACCAVGVTRALQDTGGGAQSCDGRSV
jgi:hypothetical protein